MHLSTLSKTTVSMSLEYMQSFIKIGGVIFEKIFLEETDGLLDLLLGLSNTK